jgi:hypothetical protein
MIQTFVFNTFEFGMICFFILTTSDHLGSVVEIMRFKCFCFIKLVIMITEKFILKLLRMGIAGVIADNSPCSFRGSGKLFSKHASNCLERIASEQKLY